jgi:hypothetical protein
MPVDDADRRRWEEIVRPFNDPDESVGQFSVRVWPGKWHDSPVGAPQYRLVLGLTENGYWVRGSEQFENPSGPLFRKISVEDARHLCKELGIEEPPELIDANKLSKTGFKASHGDQSGGTSNLPIDSGTPRPEPRATSKSETADPFPSPGKENKSSGNPRSLCDQVRRSKPRATLQAQLVAFMEDRESAPYLAVAENVYGDTATDGLTIKQLVVRTNATLKEIGARVSFRCGSEHVHKHISSE